MAVITRETTITGFQRFWHDGQEGFVPRIDRVVEEIPIMTLPEGDRIIPVMSDREAARVYQMGKDRFGRPAQRVLGELFVDPNYLLR